MDWARQTSSSYSKNSENYKSQNPKNENYEDPRSWYTREEERKGYNEYYKQNTDFEEKLSQFYNRKTGYKNVKFLVFDSLE